MVSLNVQAKHFPFMCTAFKIDCWPIWKYIVTTLKDPKFSIFGDVQKSSFPELKMKLWFACFKISWSQMKMVGPTGHKAKHKQK